MRSKPKTKTQKMFSGSFRKEHILHRHPENPLIRPGDLDVDAVFNCGQVMFEGLTLLLVSVCPRHGTPAMHIATSEDGVHFKMEEKPFISQLADEPWRNDDIWPIDPRVTQIGDTYYIIRPLGTKVGPYAILEKTRDWKRREFVECISLPSNRVPCLFPEKIDGLYYRIDRPYNSAPGGASDMWISASPDLIYWGRHRFMLGSPHSHVWAGKTGPTPPIKTEAGWLEIIHGVLNYAGGSRYSLGALLLDLKEPWKIIGQSDGWILTPEEPYETQGNCHNTIFTCGAIADMAEDRIRVYYGAADTCIGLASGSMTELIDECRRTPAHM